MTVLAQESSGEGSWPALNIRELSAEVGGVIATLAEIQEALDCLLSTSVPMMRRTLQQINSPLANCDYHTVAAPHRGRFLAAQSQGRGAQGRHLTKLAFCYQLQLTLDAVAECPALGFLPLLDDAYSAFGSDYAYSAAMAKAAVVVKAKRNGGLLCVSTSGGASLTSVTS